MKNFAFVFLVIMLFLSCEKILDNPEVTKIPGNPNTHFNKHILEGYFVKSIAFDSKGNAWIGTFKQGLIKYNSTETIIYNSSNSLFPDSQVIWDVAVDSKDKVWIGAEGIIEFDGQDFIFHNTQNSSIPEDFVHSIAIDSKDNVWFTSGETVNNTYLTEISESHWKTYTSEDLGFAPYYLSEIAVNSHNEVCVGVDYSLSSTWNHLGPHVFVFNGNSSIQLMIESTRSVNALAVDNEDNIWCTTGQGFAVYNWEHWLRNDSIFQESGSFEIVQAPDNAIWIGTGHGIYINE